MDIVLDTDMARPTKYDRLNLDMVREAATSLGSMEEIAALLKISPRTLLKARDADPEVDQAIAEARAAVGAKLANKMVEMALDGSVEASKFLLERRFSWIKRTQNELEVNAKAGPQIQIHLTQAAPLPDEKVLN